MTFDMRLRRSRWPALAVALLIAATLAVAASTRSDGTGRDSDSRCPAFASWKADTTAEPHWQPDPGHVDGMRINDPGSIVFDRNLVSPTVLVPESGLQIQLQQSLQLSWASSLAVLEISIAGGDWRDVYDGDERPSEGGYNGNAYAGNPLGMRPAWGGQRDEFTTMVKLPEEAHGRTVQLRLRLASSGSGDPHRGWQVSAFSCTTTG